MYTVLDLIGEFGTLNDTKLRAGGSLPPEAEKRWTELKKFYELLMTREPVQESGDAHRFTAEDIRKCLSDRDRIRVPMETPIVFEHEGRHHTARVVNLSKSGVFVASETLIEAGSSVTLFLAGIFGGDQVPLETKGEVAWCTKRGVPEADLPRGMGIRFIDFPPEAQQELDAYVVETIANRISALW